MSRSWLRSRSFKTVRWVLSVLTITFQLSPIAMSSEGGDRIAIVGGTLIDGTGAKPLEDSIVIIQGKRILAVGSSNDIEVPKGAHLIEAHGQYVIPGLMDANVHLFRDVSIEFIARYEGRFEDLIEEAAQISLKQGLTSVFDTWGPLQSLMNVRDRIDQGHVVGSRIFAAGNIVGFSGPFGREFNVTASWTASDEFVKRVNKLFTENVGPELLWMTPDQVGLEIKKYIGLGIDFLKYGASAHDCTGCSGFPQPLGLNSMLMFSPAVQEIIVDASHEAGITVQSHSSSVESLRLALAAGVDLLQHASETGPTPIPDSTIRLMVEKGVYAAELPRTQNRLKFELENPELLHRPREHTRILEENLIRLIQAGVSIVMATDSGVSNPVKTEVEASNQDFGAEHPEELGEAHFLWFHAMQSKGMEPMEMLLAATRNVAAAYGKLNSLGTIEKDKLADLVILGGNPLQDVANYRKIRGVVKGGVLVDRATLPIQRVLTSRR